MKLLLFSGCKSRRNYKHFTGFSKYCSEGTAGPAAETEGCCKLIQNQYPWHSPSNAMWFSMLNLLLNSFLFQEAGKEKLLNTLQEERKKVIYIVMFVHNRTLFSSKDMRVQWVIVTVTNCARKRRCWYWLTTDQVANAPCLRMCACIKIFLCFTLW